MTHPVGEKKPNAWGLYDMYGNVSQWCADRFSADYYKQSPRATPLGPPLAICRARWPTGNPTAVCLLRGVSQTRGPVERNLPNRFSVLVDVQGKAEVEMRKMECSTRGEDLIRDFQILKRPPTVTSFDAAKAKQRQEALAKQLRIAIATSNSIGMKFMLIPPGEFMMGSTPEEIAWALEQGRRNKEQQWNWDGVSGGGPRRHHVQITKPFSLGACPVTQKEFSIVMGWNPRPFGRRDAASTS